MDLTQEDDSSGPSSLSSDQASLCVIPDPDDSSEEDGFIYLDKSSLPASLNLSEQDRTVIVFHSVDEEYPANQDVVCQYIRPDGWEESQKDHISLFKVGWVTKNDAIFMLPLPLPSNDPIGQIIIPESMLPKDTTNLYQFCYMRDHTLLGASTPFQFTLPNVRSAYNSICEMINDDDREEQNLSCSECSDKKMAQSSLKKIPLIFDTGITDTKLDGSCEPTLGKEHSFSSGKSRSVAQSCEGISLLIGMGDVNAESVQCSSSHKTERLNASLKEGSTADQEIKFGGVAETNKKDKSQKGSLCSEMVYTSHHIDQGENFPHQTKDELSCVKQRLLEVTEEKKWFQEQYNSLLTSVKKLAEDLASERSEKESLSGYMTELSISHKMLCSENSKIHTELEILKKNLKEHSEKDEVERNALEKQLQDVSAENVLLKEKLEQLHSHIKVEREKLPPECQCGKYKKQVEDLSTRLADYEIMRSCLEVELEEEIKLGKERDQYLVQLEQVKVNNIQMSNNWLASTPNSVTNGNTLLEMEENVNSTLEALECALKEAEVLRSRKAAISKANRVLREELMQKRNEWEECLHKERDEFEEQLEQLQKKLEGEKSWKAALMQDVEVLKEQLYQKTLEQNQEKPQDLSEAMVLAQREIETLQKEKSALDRECSSLKMNFGSPGMGEEMNSTLLKNLEEAREEYKKLYAEKMRTQEKLFKLQQKVKTKKTSRVHQEANSSKADDFLNNVSTSWRATIDELM